MDHCQVQARGVPHFVGAIALGDAPRSHEPAGLGWSRFANLYFLRALGHHGAEICRTQAGSISATGVDAGQRAAEAIAKNPQKSNYDLAEKAGVSEWTVRDAKKKSASRDLEPEDDRPTIDNPPRGELWDEPRRRLIPSPSDV